MCCRQRAGTAIGTVTTRQKTWRACVTAAFGGAMSESSIVYAARSDASPRAELSALANIYKFVLDCHAKNEATRPGSPDDAKEIKNDSRHKHRNT